MDGVRGAGWPLGCGLVGIESFAAAEEGEEGVGLPSAPIVKGSGCTRRDQHMFEAAADTWGISILCQSRAVHMFRTVHSIGGLVGCCARSDLESRAVVLELESKHSFSLSILMVYDPKEQGYGPS